jgi:arginine N-succinyltransferase
VFILRSVRHEDFASLLALANKVGVGMTTLKAEPRALRARIDLAVRSFSGMVEARDADFVFVLEDGETGRVVGVSALKAGVGFDEPFYNFRMGRHVHSCRELGVYSDKRTLYLCNDFTGSAELCTLFLDPDYRTGDNGRLLSKSRLLFAANCLEQLPETMVAELRGFQRQDGTSPFWESLGRHFFRIDFDKADDFSSLGPKSFIAELMPRYPVYTDFLTDEAQGVIGVVHPDTVPARRLLEQEGFRYEGYVDIFDGGPVLQAHTRELRIVKESHLVLVARSACRGNEAAPVVLVANTRRDDFKVIATRGALAFGRLEIVEAEMSALGLTDGDPVRVTTMNPQERLHA